MDNLVIHAGGEAFLEALSRLQLTGRLEKISLVGNDAQSAAATRQQDLMQIDQQIADTGWQIADEGGAAARRPRRHLPGRPARRLAGLALLAAERGAMLPM